MPPNLTISLRQTLISVLAGYKTCRGVVPTLKHNSSNFLVSNNNTYDSTLTIPSGSRAHYTITCWNNTDVFPDHTEAYNRILFQLWVNNMSTPYYGELSGIGVFTPIDTTSPFAPGRDQLTIEIINSSATSKTIYLKAYAITTLTSAQVGVDGYI